MLNTTHPDFAAATAQICEHPCEQCKSTGCQLGHYSAHRWLAGGRAGIFRQHHSDECVIIHPAAGRGPTGSNLSRASLLITQLYRMCCCNAACQQARQSSVTPTHSTTSHLLLLLVHISEQHKTQHQIGPDPAGPCLFLSSHQV